MTCGAVPKAGFHALRRFRTTWLRKRRAPEDLITFWHGHAKQSVTDGYPKLGGWASLWWVKDFAVSGGPSAAPRGMWGY
jgi:hypothetical protein